MLRRRLGLTTLGQVAGVGSQEVATGVAQVAVGGEAMALPVSSQ
jgi:hypothetical protein